MSCLDQGTKGLERFGAYLRDLRDARRLTLDDVEYSTRAAIEPVTRSLLSRLENGKARLSALKLLGLARVYGVRFATLTERLETEVNAGDSHGFVHTAESTAQSSECEYGESSLDQVERLLDRHQTHSARALLDKMLQHDLQTECRVRALILYASCALKQDQLPLAEALLQAIELMPAPTEPQRSMATQLRAELETRRGRCDEEAVGFWLAALDGARSSRDVRRQAECMVNLARCSRMRRQLVDAQGWCEKAIGLCADGTLRRIRIQAAVELARVHRRAGSSQSARDLLLRARGDARDSSYRSELIEIYVELWQLARQERDEPAARSAARSVRHLVRLVERLPANLPGALLPARSRRAS